MLLFKGNRKIKRGESVNLQHLKYVVEVEKTGSITQAAQNLYMGQPNLSKAIKELEKNLGIVIFKRTSKGVLPTAQGEEFLRYAKSILDQVQRMENLYRSAGEQTGFSISIPRAGYIAYAFGLFLSRMEESQRGEVHFRETNISGIIRDVAQGESGLGIIRCQAAREDYFRDLLADQSITARPLWDFTYQVLFSKTHPLASAPFFEPDALCPYTEILYGDRRDSDPFVPDSVRQRELHAGKKIWIYERSSQFDLLCQIPGSFMWASPVPPAMLDRYGLVQRKCGVTGQRAKDLLIFLDGHRLNPWEEGFIQELERVWAQIAPLAPPKREG